MSNVQHLDMFPIYNHNKNILYNNESLTKDDLLIEPQRGMVDSRTQVQNNLGRFLFTAPMDTVTNFEIYYKSIYETNFICPVLSRVHFHEFMTQIELNLLPDFIPNKEDIIVKLINNGFISIGSSNKDYDDLANFIDHICNYSEVYYNNLHFNICIDVAHGWAKNPIDIIIKLKEKYKDRISIMSGSIATRYAAAELYNLGVDYLRVGIGPGAMCSTRVITGVGVPQISAIADIFNQVYELIETSNINMNFDYNRKVHIVSDGGIKYPGDIAKYMVAGATGCMIGTAFANCIDSPAKVSPDGLKIHRGQASEEFQMEHMGYVRNGVAEGVTKKLIIDKPFITKANWFLNGLKSTVSYIGGDKISHLNPINCRFIRVSNSTYYENKPME